MDKELRCGLGRILNLEREPVALRWSIKIPEDIDRIERKFRFCTKLDMATRGKIFYSTLEEEECMGGARYCGLKDPRDNTASVRSGDFLVSMGVYKSIPAVQRSWRSNMAIEPGIFKALSFAPLSKAQFDADVIVVISNAEQAMKILHANAYDSGKHGTGADSGPICSSMAAIPYLTGKVTYGFADLGARRNMEMRPDEVIVSIPGSELSRIISNIEEMIQKKVFRQ